MEFALEPPKIARIQILSTNSSRAEIYDFKIGQLFITYYFIETIDHKKPSFLGLFQSHLSETTATVICAKLVSSVNWPLTKTTKPNAHFCVILLWIWSPKCHQNVILKTTSIKMCYYVLVLFWMVQMMQKFVKLFPKKYPMKSKHKCIDYSCKMPQLQSNYTR